MSELETAANENTPADILRELALNEDSLVRQKVAMNPNTPTEVLLDLGAEFPNELLDNPVFDLLVLENPNLAEEIPEETLASILETKREIPNSLIERAEKLCQYGGRASCKLVKAVALRPQTPISIIEPLLITNRCDLLRDIRVVEIYHNHNFKAENLVSLVRIIDDNKVRYYVAQHPNMSGKILDWLTEDIKKIDCKTDIYVGLIRKAVAEHHNTFENTLEKLASDRTKINNLGRDIRKGVAQNHNTSLKVLEKLARDESDRVKMSVAVHPKFTVDLILKYITDDAELANNIWEAKQTDISVKMLEKLAKNESILVRLAVAKNANTPAEAIETLWQKEVIYLISEAIYKHPNTPAKVLQELMPSI